MTDAQIAWLARTGCKVERVRVKGGRPSPWAVISDRGVRLGYGKTPQDAVKFAMRRYELPPRPD